MLSVNPKVISESLRITKLGGVVAPTNVTNAYKRNTLSSTNVTIFYFEFHCSFLVIDYLELLILPMMNEIDDLK